MVQLNRQLHEWGAEEGGAGEWECGECAWIWVAGRQAAFAGTEVDRLLAGPERRALALAVRNKGGTSLRRGSRLGGQAVRLRHRGGHPVLRRGGTESGLSGAVWNVVRRKVRAIGPADQWPMGSEVRGVFARGRILCVERNRRSSANGAGQSEGIYLGVAMRWEHWGPDGGWTGEGRAERMDSQGLRLVGLHGGGWGERRVGLDLEEAKGRGGEGPIPHWFDWEGVSEAGEGGQWRVCAKSDPDRKGLQRGEESETGEDASGQRRELHPFRGDCACGCPVWEGGREGRKG